MERFFKLDERNTTVKIEFIAGMTIFFAMVYILMVNANMFANPFGDGSNPLGVSYFEVFKSGFDFSAYTAQHGSANLLLTH